MERFLPVNVIILAVVSGMMSLVLSGFTGWHISLAVRGLTTIECLEKTRYLAPVRKTLDRHRREWQQQQPRPRNAGKTADGLGRTLQGYGQQFIDMHANAIPGVTRAEEGEERASPTIGTRIPGPIHHSHDYNPDEHYDQYQSPAQQSLFRSYGELDRAREHDRYEEYLAECDSEKLPHAFDLGWRRNLLHLFGPNPFLWPIPICTTVGDGWRWEASSKWQEARNRIEQQRIQRWEEANRERQQFWQRASLHSQSYPAPNQQHSWHGSEPHPGNSWTGRFNSTGNLRPGPYTGNSVEDRPSTGVSMKTLRPMSPRPRPGERDIDIDEASDHYSTSSDEATEQQALVSNDDAKQTPSAGNGQGATEEWVDWD
ncbi:palmitoyltransferase for Vac8p [Microsporum canis]